MTAFNKLLGMMKQAGTLGQAQKEMVSTKTNAASFQKDTNILSLFFKPKNNEFLLTMGTDVICPSGLHSLSRSFGIGHRNAR